ncbi:MAG: TonB family protein [Gemmatimonadaceae bacterium]|nr:TonB family protein [Gemmatimonadaceae bacterium]
MQRIALLESEKHAGKPGAGSAASIALHVLVLAFAVAVTSHAGVGNTREQAVYIPLPRWKPEVRMVSQPVMKRALNPSPRVPAISVAVPTLIPSIIPAPTIPEAVPTAIGTTTISIPGAQSGTDTTAATVLGGAPFAADEVDVAASALPGQRGPAYPEAPRAIGLEGRVVARFIIGKKGRVEADPTIVSATDYQFASAVKRYLATARYRPATKNGEPVRQLAEQEFDFTVRH